jgi:hypothetical protein
MVQDAETGRDIISDARNQHLSLLALLATISCVPVAIFTWIEL